MLVLSRKKGEKLLIGDEVEIIVIEVDGERVKLGIKAPKGVKILRTELIEEIKGENKAAFDLSLKAFEEIEKNIRENRDLK
ncbi:carbon storage regulator, CsrA [Caldanaerovirga acetigignens]|uniref:Translational regulator CsrA n=1 Tax=Caldanaerovirga acetigignens TaxID=447595 RepID=A0A1M7ICF2_9FIRM|nr:carbon storage regulator CsrA [Caldanaerovirga acetigignens]SHM38380.1 carbon storage regulator, CsrA [Caldanaerovirga acetigignens]